MAKSPGSDEILSKGVARCRVWAAAQLGSAMTTACSLRVQEVKRILKTVLAQEAWF